MLYNIICLQFSTYLLLLFECNYFMGMFSFFPYRENLGASVANDRLVDIVGVQQFASIYEHVDWGTGHCGVMAK